MFLFSIAIFALAMSFYIVKVNKTTRTFKISMVFLALSFAISTLLVFDVEIKSPLVYITEKFDIGDD